MIVTCEKCGHRYDDAKKWTICPHNELGTPARSIEDVLVHEAREILTERERWHSACPEAYPEEAVYDDTHALMRTSTFRALPEYSCSVPTGVYPGKTWRRHDEAGDWVGRYDDNHDGVTCSTRFRRPLLVD